jgi:hypothetical protein
MAGQSEWMPSAMHWHEDGVTFLRVRNNTTLDEASMLTIIKVENTLYRVHRGVLIQKSPIFRDMFALPSAENQQPEGTHQDNPIFLEQVTSEEFDDLLQWIYKM